ncbi:MAG: outer membrane lipoprotein-sorting protein [Candidatus Marinimicrobia bacterium]|nr:outer membrane lipoprotein-sorting protein [Candidatus Neomarinimicrobiota bacterium]
MTQTFVRLPFLMSLLIAGNLLAEDMSAVEILIMADSVANAPQDQYMESTMVLIDKDGDEKERKMVMHQKGADMRLVRFLSPADQKGISFLSLPDDVMYLYLPAFRKIRMIASHVKNQNFAGTDFSYDDMSSFKFAEEYDPVLTEPSNEHYQLELTPKASVDKDYSKLIMTITKDSYVSIRVEYYDKGGNLWKVMTKDEISRIGGYWVAKVMQMQDLKKNHSTKMIINEIEYDMGQSDDIYTKRNLKRTR